MADSAYPKDPQKLTGVSTRTHFGQIVFTPKQAGFVWTFFYWMTPWLKYWVLKNPHKSSLLMAWEQSEQSEFLLTSPTIYICLKTTLWLWQSPYYREVSDPIWYFYKTQRIHEDYAKLSDIFLVGRNSGDN